MKSQRITKVSMIHPLGTMNVCIKNCLNPSDRCWDISVWAKVAALLTWLQMTPKSPFWTETPENEAAVQFLSDCFPSVIFREMRGWNYPVIHKKKQTEAAALTVEYEYHSLSGLQLVFVPKQTSDSLKLLWFQQEEECYDKSRIQSLFSLQLIGLVR